MQLTYQHNQHLEACYTEFQVQWLKIFERAGRQWARGELRWYCPKTTNQLSTSRLSTTSAIFGGVYTSSTIVCKLLIGSKCVEVGVIEPVTRNIELAGIFAAPQPI